MHVGDRASLVLLLIPPEPAQGVPAYTDCKANSISLNLTCDEGVAALGQVSLCPGQSSVDTRADASQTH